MLMLTLIRGERGRFKTVDGRIPEVTSSSTPDSDGVLPFSPANGGLSEDHGTLAKRRQSRVSDAEQWSMVTNNTNRPARRTRGITYLGESWSLSYSRHLGSGMSSRIGSKDLELHLPTPDSPDESAPPNVHPTRNLVLQRILNSIPAPHIQTALIKAYLTHGYPLYPIIDPSPFRSGTVPHSNSPLLLLSVLFSGASHVGESVIHQAGYGSRLECLDAFYSQAKTLFDADLETDKVAVVQCAFMLHNWWSGPTATMDPLAWLGHATRLAQNMGMHRSTAGSSIDAADRKLCKRIWWSIYVCALTLIRAFS